MLKLLKINFFYPVLYNIFYISIKTEFNYHYYLISYSQSNSESLQSPSGLKGLILLGI